MTSLASPAVVCVEGPVGYVGLNLDGLAPLLRCEFGRWHSVAHLFVVLRALAPRRVRPQNELMSIRGGVVNIGFAYRLERSATPISM